MPTAIDITKTVMKYSAIPPERIRIVRRFEELPMSQIRRGVVYLLAAWSGPSVMFFRQVTKLMGDLDSEPEFYVIDMDCVPADFFAATFGRQAPAGAGETIWIRDGVVAAAVAAYASTDIDVVFLRHTRELFHDDKG